MKHSDIASGRFLMPVSQLFLLFLLILPGSAIIYAQDCSLSSATAKYWQYRERFNRHFIAIDRDSSGCIHDGIGQDTIDPCKCSKAGLGLPATSINIEPHGGNGMVERNGDTSSVWYDPACGGDVSWIHHKKHNFLDVGSETPTQIGWYLVTLCTEYELLRKNGQAQEAQRTLEEIFLCLQTIKRLDIKAQCLAKQRYDAMKASYDKSGIGLPLLCASPYTDHCHRHFDTEYDPDCNYAPQTDGYAGFILREDASQALEPLLHDSTEGKYNIDMVLSGHAMSLKPPCQSVFDQVCYLYHEQNFMSQDQLIGMMTGLAFVKRYISAADSATTCDGKRHPILSSAQKMATAFIDRVDDGDGHISWPGAEDCLNKEAKLSECEGGNLTYTMRGLRQTKNYICGTNDGPHFFERAKWGLLGTQTRNTNNANANFFLGLSVLGVDLSTTSSNYQWGQIQEPCKKFNKQIYPVMNNLLYPGGGSIATEQNYLKEMLCSAPCEGPCNKKLDYDREREKDSLSMIGWPEFECPNTPNWLGQRWDGSGLDPTGLNISANRIFNGLDYMALHNMYLLQYNPDASFYNPAQPQGNVMGLNSDNYTGDEYISGPNLLCPGQKGQYSVLPTYGTNPLTNITWASSSNLSLSGQNAAQISATMNSVQNPSFIEVSLQQNRTTKQYFAGVGYGDSTTISTNGGTLTLPGLTATDRCYITYRKPISSESANFNLVTDIQHCLHIHQAFISPLPDTSVKITWSIFDEVTGRSATGTSAMIDYSNIIDPTVAEGMVRITMKINSNCGISTTEQRFRYYCDPGDGWENTIHVTPNPTDDHITVTFTTTPGGGCSGEPFAGSGVSVSIYPVNSAYPVINGTIYANGSTINVNHLPNGVYRIVGRLCNAALPSGTLFVISRL